jgi:hypothetical protein
MDKRYKHNQDDIRIFHYGLIKMIMVYELGLRRDCWGDFLSQNNFEDSSPSQVDKPVVSERKHTPLCALQCFATQTSTRLTYKLTHVCDQTGRNC